MIRKANIKYVLALLCIVTASCKPHVKKEEKQAVQQTSETKMEGLRKNKMSRGLLGFICCLLLTACSSSINQRYAGRLMRNANTSFYPKSTGYPVCLSGKVIIQFFEDSAQTKKSPVRMETLYNKPEQIRQYSMFINEALYSNDIYYRNNYQLIDSIVKTDSKGLKSKIVFTYEKNRFSIVSRDEKSTMSFNIFYLDNRYRCIKNESFNGSGDKIGSTSYSYDKHGRITEETDETRIIKYEYKNEHAPIYAAMRLYDKKSGELQTETLQQQDKNRVINISKNNGRVFLKTILVTTPDGCVKTVYCYNGDNKITQVYEYIFQH